MTGTKIPPSKPPFQFGLAALFGLMAIVAVVVAMPPFLVGIAPGMWPLSLLALLVYSASRLDQPDQPAT